MAILADLALRITTQTAELNKGLALASNSVNRFKKDSKDTGTEVSKAFSSLQTTATSSLNNLSSSLGLTGSSGAGAVSGISSLSKAFGLLNIAMGPIGLIIAAIAIAIAALASYFKNTERGADQFKVIMATLGGIMDRLRDVFIKLGEIIVDAFSKPRETIQKLGDLIEQNIINRFKAFGLIGKAIAKIFSKDWKEGLKELGDGVVQLTTGISDASGKIKKVGEEIKKIGQEALETGKKSAEIQRRENDLRKIKRAWIVDEKILQNEINQLKLDAVDKTKTDEERQKALSEVIAKQNELYARKIQIATAEYEIQRDRNALAESSADDLDKEAQLQGEIIDLDNQRLSANKELTGQLSELTNRINNQKEAVDGVTDATKEQADATKEVALNLDNIVQKHKETYDQIEARINDYHKKGVITEKEYNDSIIALRQEQIDALNDIENTSFIGKFQAIQALRAAIIADHEAGLTSEIEYHDQLRALNTETYELINAIVAATGEYITGWLNALTNLYTANKNNEINKLNEQKEKELKAAGDNETKKTAIEKKFADKKAEIEKKYAEKQKKIDIAMAIINGAVGVTAAFKNGPILGVILAALVIASTVAQVALIKSQSFAKGGVVSGLTFATVGDYPGAHFNREIITPENKMAEVFKNTLSQFLTGRDNQMVTAVIEGTSLRIVNNKIEKIYANY